MKKSLTFLFFTFVVTIAMVSKCNGQVKKDSKATLLVTPNQVQVEKLNENSNEQQRTEVRRKDLIELIIGYKLEDVDSLRVENGQFKFVLRKK